MKARLSRIVTVIILINAVIRMVCRQPSHEQSLLTCINELHKSSFLPTMRSCFMNVSLTHARIGERERWLRHGCKVMNGTRSKEREDTNPRNDSAMRFAVTCRTAYNFRLLSGDHHIYMYTFLLSCGFAHLLTSSDFSILAN